MPVRPGRGHGAGDNDDQGLVGAGSEFARMVVDYAKQETLGPIKALGRFVAWGVVGSVLLSVGLLLLVLALLRALQDETATFHGNLSWVPYLICLGAAAVVIGLSGWRIAQGPARRVGAGAERGKRR